MSHPEDMSLWARLRRVTYERWMLLLTLLWTVAVGVVVIGSLDDLNEDTHRQLVVNESILANLEDCLDPAGTCARNQAAITQQSRRYGNQVALYSAYCAVAQVAEQRATVITVANIQRCVDDLIAMDRRRTRSGEFPPGGAP